MDIATYLDAKKLTQAEFARRIGCDRSNFHRIVNGVAKPTLAQAVAIERESGGLIAVERWVEAA